MATSNERQLELSEAVGEITTSWQNAIADGRRSPFFMFVGAGISLPVVPSAIAMAAMFKVIALQRGKQRESAGAMAVKATAVLGDLEQDRFADVEKEYSRWFQRAFPSPFERARQLRELIEDKLISQSNFRLAVILSSRRFESRIADFVVTTNFDDFLSRALTIFGTKHVVHSHPAAIDRIEFPNPREVQIVHLHGDYRFYDCRNLSAEITSAPSSGENTRQDMADFLRKLMPERMPRNETGVK